MVKHASTVKTLVVSLVILVPFGVAVVLGLQVLWEEYGHSRMMVVIAVIYGCAAGYLVYKIGVLVEDTMNRRKTE